MSTKPIKIAYYITPHGFGHAVRSLEVVRTLLQSPTPPEVVLVTDIPSFLVDQNAGRALPCRKRRLDVGLVQKDSLRFDLEATLKVLEELRVQSEVLVREEERFYREEGIEGIVSDIPFLPFRAAAQCGIPSAGMSNFTWDWIYEGYARNDPRWRPLVSWIRQAYSQCGLFLQLPMHGDCSACPNIRDVPLVSRKARRSRNEVRTVLGVPPERKVYLISFAYLDLDGEALRRVEKLDRCTFLYKKPLSFRLANGICLDGLDLSYPDVVAAVDGVITKPGYGIAADCLSHGTPMIYTDRGFFVEYDILVAAMRKHLPTVYVSSPELYAGRWDQAIQALEAQPVRRLKMRDDGAAVCASSILRHLTVQ